MQKKSQLNVTMNYSKYPGFTEILEYEIEQRIGQLDKAKNKKVAFKDIYAEAMKATENYIDKKLQHAAAKIKPKIVTWNPKLVEYHGKKRQARLIKQNEEFNAVRKEFRKTLIQSKKPKEDYIKIININNKFLMKNQIINISIDVEYYPLTENTVKVIGDFAWEQLQKVVSGLDPKKYAGGYNKGIMLYFIDPDSNKPASFGLYNPSHNDILKLVANKAGVQYDTANYILYLSSVHIIISKLPKAGGCRDGKTVVEKLAVTKTDFIKLHNLKSKNNNCLIQCFIIGSNQIGNKVKPDIVRHKVGLPLNTKIDIDDISKISDYFQKGYILINQNYNIIGQKKYNDPSDYILIYLRNDHYYLAEVMEILDKCPACGDRNINSKTHRCNLKQMSYYQKKLCRRHNMVSVKNISKPKIDYNNVIHFDLETFQESINHVPYACGWYNGEYKYTYGKNCIDEFINLITKMEEKTISAYNGSGFDFYFLIDKLTNLGVEVRDIILTNGKVMTFKFGNKNKIFDLKLFIMSSLDKACKDFKIKNAKSSFDHKKIKNWDNVEQYKNEVVPYLELDVKGLKELFEVFNEMMYDIKQINITDYITLSHMSYEIWASMLTHHIEIPNDIVKYDFIKQATYGGRCYPMQKQFKSKHFDDVVNKKMNYKDLIKTGDFIYNADATSLYPASMKGFEHLEVSYPTGKSRWSDNPVEEWNNNRIGFYKIKFCPPKDLRTPILPRKVNLGIRWSLVDGVGVYTSVDIRNSIDVGYKVEFIEKCLVWDSSNDVYSQYIEEFYKMKEVAEREGNKVKRSIAKLMMNALYGKSLQKAIFTQTTIVNNIFEFNNFLVDKKTNNFEWIVLGNDKMIVSGEVKDEQKGTHITKPCQLGAFVTAYSRRLMLFFMKAIDPTFKRMPFTYSDTDSMHILGADYIKLKNLGYIKNKSDSQLGYLCADIDNEGIIIKEKNLAPKTYNYTYINNKNEIDSVRKCKGIPNECLKNEYYESEIPTEVQFSGIKKKHKTLTKKDKELGLAHFSIVNNSQTRTFNKSTWQGMIFRDGCWYPYGFEFN